MTNRKYKGLGYYFHKVDLRVAFRIALRLEYGDQCFWCGMMMDFSHPGTSNYASVEHLLPRTDERVGEIEFIRLTCSVCNKAPVLAHGVEYDEDVIKNIRREHVKVRGIQYVDGEIIETGDT